MKEKLSIIIAFLSVFYAGCSGQKEQVSIILSPNAKHIEELAAQELVEKLQIVYPDYIFSLEDETLGDWQIHIGTQGQLAEELTSGLPVPENKEGYLVKVLDGKTAVITSKSETGVLYGVYALLEQLGYSYTLDSDIVPVPRKAFDLSNWDLSDYPLAVERTVFNWHNFLSGCTAWDENDWKRWISQSQKMGYNTIMVHLYANNPMFTFEFNGMEKEVGYMATSNKGRDWSTEHVNDVRRLPGGIVFEEAVFGAEVAQVADSIRGKAVQEMMGEVFSFAEQRGIKLNLALDFDLTAAIPQDMVESLPEPDRFQVYHPGIVWMNDPAGNFWVPRPDTKGGYTFYKTQVEKLLALYPQIDNLILWKRVSASLWQSIEYEELPKPWKNEYDSILAANPELAQQFRAAANFAQTKLIKAVQKVLKELNRENIDLSVGTWRWENYPAMSELFPDEVKLYILDSEVIRDDDHLHNPEMFEKIASQSEAGQLVPIIWPHHDDGAYLGNSQPTYENFHQMLTDLKSNRFGMIHWMTRPFDMYFIHHNKQVWASTKDQTLTNTLENLGEAWFGEANALIMTKYLNAYHQEMPSFGRETSPDFIDDKHYYKFDSVANVLEGIDNRMELLGQADTTLFTPSQKDRYRYFVDFEVFVELFYQQQALYLQFRDEYESGDLKAAKETAAQFNPESALEQYSRTIQNGVITKGEKGILFSMGVRWLPQFESARQLVGLAPIRIRFAPTQHEKLAQMPGFRTYFIDENRKFWKVMGEHELQHPIDKNQEEGSGATYEYTVSLDAGLTIPLQNYSTKDALQGRFQLELLIPADDENGMVNIACAGQHKRMKVSEITEEKIYLVFDGNEVTQLNIESGEPGILLSGLILKRTD